MMGNWVNSPIRVQQWVAFVLLPTVSLAKGALKAVNE
jgi:hypothetical protein